MPYFERFSDDSVYVFQGGVPLDQYSFPREEESSPFRGQAIVECCSQEAMERFIASRDSLPIERRSFLSSYTLDQYLAEGARLFLTADGRGGFAVLGGELASLFSLPGANYGESLVRFAIEQGASKLNCYDNGGKLLSLYSRCGFREIFRAPWNEQYAPSGWDYAAWGRPDYVEMSL